MKGGLEIHHSRIASRRTIIIVIAVFLISLNLRASITSVGPLLTTVQQSLGISSLTASLLTAIPVFCMGVFAPLTGVLSARFGIEKAIGLCVVLIGVGTALRIFAHSSILLLITAVLVGIGIAIAGPLISGFLKQQFPDNAPSMIGVYTLGIGVGATMSAGLAVPISVWFHHSWSTALGIWALLAIVALAIWYPLSNRLRRDAVQVTSGRLPWTHGRAWLLLAGFGLQSGIYYSVATWLPARVEEMGYSVQFAGNVITAFSVCQVIVNFGIPVVANRSPNRTPWLLGCAGFILSGLFLICFAASFVSPWIIVFLLGIGLGGIFPLMLILPLDETMTGDEASRWTAMMQCGGYIMSGLIPMAMGTIRDTFGSFQMAFVALFVLSILLITIILFMRVHTVRTRNDHSLQQGS